MNGIIRNDCFNIAKRLKSIDKNYYIVFNKKLSRFEIHYKRLLNSLELILPFERLDKRTLDYVLRTRIENREKLIKEIDEYNEKLEKKKNIEIKEQVLAKYL